MKRIIALVTLVAATGFFASGQLSSEEHERYWIKAKATNKYQRSAIANTGVSIITSTGEFVYATGSKAELAKVAGLAETEIVTSFALTAETMDFPEKDEKFHNYAEVQTAINEMITKYPTLIERQVIGQTHEGRDIVNLRISGNLKESSTLPAAIFMGAHHAREHLSVEMPLMLAQHLVSQYHKDPKIKELMDHREINIIPMVNADGAEYDIKDGKYKMWRKNRAKNHNGTFGVDLNRNYGFGWGTGGSSKSPNSDVYMGEKPFSEPESQAIKNFVESRENATILVSFHTFSELILYPWGHVYDPIANAKDLKVYETMATTMAKWNNYTPQQSSDLYIASGDTTDWAYGEHGIFAFTFELDPKSMWQGGFYPGQKKIDVVFKKNINPCLYLIENAQNPYDVLKAKHKTMGLNSALVR